MVFTGDIADFWLQKATFSPLLSSEATSIGHQIAIGTVLQALSIHSPIYDRTENVLRLRGVTGKTVIFLPTVW